MTVSDERTTIAECRNCDEVVMARYLYCESCKKKADEADER